jgi:carbon-monoxide dehydrogenase small subunit
MTRITLSLRLDDRDVRAEVDPASTLAEVLREDFGVRGVRVGCANGDCGACTARVDGAYLKTCLVLPHRAEGTEVHTLDGMGSEDDPTPLQAAFVASYAFQCGFCLPGMLFAAQDLLHRRPHPTEPEVRDALSGNVCRCTGYHNAVAAVLRAADATPGATPDTDHSATPETAPSTATSPTTRGPAR